MPKQLSNPTLTSKKIHKESRRPTINSYQDFINTLYDDLEYIFRQFARSKNIHYQSMVSDNRANGENLINVEICDRLDIAGWDAIHDPNINGHCDIVVTFPYTDYEWLAEAKIRGSKTYHYKGLKQLLHRYSTGDDNAIFGGMILYITTTKLPQKRIMEQWQSDIKELDEQQQTIESIADDQISISKANRFEPCPKSTLAFNSYHSHPSSGLEYCVRHMSIDFRYQPKD